MLARVALPGKAARMTSLSNNTDWERIMKTLFFAAAAATLWLGAASAQTAHQDHQNQKSQPSPGTVGAMGRSSSNGVATDPQAVKAQDGNAAKASPGTVGAAPGTTAPAQPK